MLIGLFVTGTVWFWVLLGVATLLIGLWVAHESYVKATFCVILTLAALGFFGDFNVLTWLRGNWTEFAVYLVAYFAAGIVWSVGKWWFFVRNKRDEYDERKRQFLTGRGYPGDGPMPEKLKTDWRNSVDADRPYDRRATFPPKARAFKGKIMAWMMYWPWSFLVTIVDDPVRKFFNLIFRAIHGVFQRISDGAFHDVKHDFEAPVPKPPLAAFLAVANGDSTTPAPPPSGDEGWPNDRNA